MNVVDTQPGTVADNAPGNQPVNGVTLRYLTDTQEDADFAGTLSIEAFRGKMEYIASKEKIPALITWTNNYHRGQDPSFYSRTLIAESDGRKVGVIQVQYSDSTGKVEEMPSLGCWRTCRLFCFECRIGHHVSKNKCYVDHIAVADGMRGKGVGKLLLDRADYDAKQRNCTTIYLYVMSDNPAIRLYERHGYTNTGTKSCCVGCVTGPPGKFFIMSKQL